MLPAAEANPIFVASKSRVGVDGFDRDSDSFCPRLLEVDCGFCNDLLLIRPGTEEEEGAPGLASS